MKEQMRVKGHYLIGEGESFFGDGSRIWGRRSGMGCGKCSCGALSEKLPSDAARKRWHRQHKEEVLKEGA